MYNIRQKIQNILDSDYNTQEKIKIKGEVFTPWQLIEEMLDKLPKRVWTDPKKTWLDPAAGLGNFHSIVVERLMVGLSEWEPNEEQRYKHIIENQLYFIELNPRSAVWIRRLFNPNKTYKMNLVCADSLDKDHPGWNKVGYMWDENDKGLPNVRRNKKEKEKLEKELSRIKKELEKTKKELKKAELERNRIKEKRPEEEKNPAFYADKQIRVNTRTKYKHTLE